METKALKIRRRPFRRRCCLCRWLPARDVVRPAGALGVQGRQRGFLKDRHSSLAWASRAAAQLQALPHVMSTSRELKEAFGTQCSRSAQTLQTPSFAPLCI